MDARILPEHKENKVYYLVGNVIPVATTSFLTRRKPKLLKASDVLQSLSTDNKNSYLVFEKKSDAIEYADYEANIWGYRQEDKEICFNYRPVFTVTLKDSIKMEEVKIKVGGHAKDPFPSEFHEKSAKKVIFNDIKTLIEAYYKSGPFRVENAKAVRDDKDNLVDLKNEISCKEFRVVITENNFEDRFLPNNERPVFCTIS